MGILEGGGGGVGLFSLRSIDILKSICFNFTFFSIGFFGWGLGGIPGSEAERTTCHNRRGRDETKSHH